MRGVRGVFLALAVAVALACAPPALASGVGGDMVEYAYAMQHSFGASPWSDCGVLRTRVTKKASAVSSVEFQGVKVAWTHKSFQGADHDAFGALVEADGFYRVRIAAAPTDAGVATDDDDGFVITSLRARCLGEASFRDHFNLHFDAAAGATLVSAEHVAGRAGGASGACVVGSAPDRWERGATTSSVKFAKAAPSLAIAPPTSPSGKSAPPPGYANLASDDAHDNEDGSDGEEGGAAAAKRKEPETWLGKNWMLVLGVGMMVLNIAGTVLNPPPQQQQRQQAAQQRR